MPTPLRDGAFVQLFEAIVIGLILIAVAFFAMTFDHPSAAPSQARLDLQDETHEGLRSLVQLRESEPAYGHIVAARAVIEALQGHDELLTAYLDEVLPVGAIYNVYLSNGYDRTALHYTREPVGMTSGASAPLELSWGRIFTTPDVDTYSGLVDEPLGVLTVPMEGANPVMDPASLVHAEMIGNATAGSGEIEPFHLHFYFQTGTAPAPDPAEHAVAVLRLECQDPLPPNTPYVCQSADLATFQDAIQHDALRAEWNFNLTVTNAGDHAIPAGARLAIDIPAGVHATTKTRLPQWGTDWELERAPSVLGGDALVVRSLHAIAPAETVRLPFDVAEPVADLRFPSLVFEASLNTTGADPSGSVFQHAFFPVRFALAPTGTGVPTLVYPNVPYPHGPVGTTKEWAFVVAAPTPGPTVDLARLTIEGGGLGEGVRFDCVGAPGDQVCRPTKRIWRPQLTTTGVGLAEFSLSVKGADAPIHAEVPNWPVDPTAAFENLFESTPGGLIVAPDVYYRLVPPSDATPTLLEGYPRHTEPIARPNSGSWPYTVASQWGPNLLSGVDSYNTTAGASFAVVGTRDALQSGRVQAAPYAVPLGTDVTIDVDMDALVTFLANEPGASGTEAVTRIWAPYSMDSGVPWKVIRHEVAAGSVHTPNALAGLQVDGAGAEDVVVAMADGRVVALDGETGRVLAAHTFTLPAVEAGLTASATHLAFNPRAATPLVVGTSEGDDGVYGLDPAVSRVWGSDKPDVTRPTLGINNSLDVTGDGEPDVVASFAMDISQIGQGGAASKIVVYDGATGAEELAWSRWVEQGDAERVGFLARGGARGPWAWATTGPSVASQVQGPPVSVNPNGDALRPGLPQTDVEVAYQEYGPGLVAWDGDRRPWKVPGIAFRDALAVDVDGDGWSELVAGDDQGYVYGFNASAPSSPIDGVVVSGDGATVLGPFVDASAAGAEHGFAATRLGYVAWTRTGWTRFDVHRVSIGAASVNAVGAIDATSAYVVGSPGLLRHVTDAGASSSTPTPTITVPKKFTIRSNELKQGGFGLGNPAMVELNFTGVWAESSARAWLAGRGRVTQTAFAGELDEATGKLKLTEFKCEDASGLTVPCGFDGVVDAPDGALWFYGDDGLLLRRNGPDDWELVSEAETGMPCTSPGEATGGCPDLRGGAFTADGTVAVFVGDEGALWRRTMNGPTPSWDDLSVPAGGEWRDVAVGTMPAPGAPARLVWLAVGATGEVLAAFDGAAGEWFEVPIPRGLIGLAGTAPLRAVQWPAEAPTAAILGGSGTDGLLAGFGGTTTWGQAYTLDLNPSGADHNWLELDFSEAVIAEGPWGNVTVAAARDLAGPWTLMKGPGETGTVFSGGVPCGTFPPCRQGLYLNFTMQNGAAARWSPLLRGKIGVDVWDLVTVRTAATIDFNATTVAGTMDLSRASLETGTVVLPGGATAGELRLPGGGLLWVRKVAPGAQVTGLPEPVQDLAVGDVDGDGVVEVVVGAGVTEPVVDVFHPQVGTRLAGWTPMGVATQSDCASLEFNMRGAAGRLLIGVPIQALATQGRVGVVTRTDSGWPTAKHAVHEVDATGLLGWCSEWSVESEPATAAIIHEVDDMDSGDIIVATQPSVGGPGHVYALLAPLGSNAWTGTPSVQGKYRAQVSVDWSSQYGVYIVESMLAWNVNALDAQRQAITTPQVARVLSTFMVVSPQRNGYYWWEGMLSPSYAIEAITWMDFWESSLPHRR